jgi:uncharacterized phage protein gp47/JayE|nr:MAG TPA: Baseplate J like protein [Caudoviricetes sp.]
MTLEEIIEYLLSSIPDEYDISVGSFFYDLLYPVAEQAYILQNKIDSLSTNTFALTATGEYLDRKTAEQGITRKAATYARGKLRITGNRGEVVSKGAKVAADNMLFSVDETVSIPESGFVEVEATCTLPGKRGNIKKGGINRFPITLPGITAVENVTDFTGGYDAESDAELLERYLEKVSRPNVSGNKYHYIEWAREVDGVGDVRVIPLWNGAGTVKVVIVDVDNQPATPDLIARVKAEIEDNRPIGANVTVVSAEALVVNIVVTLMKDKTPDIEQNIKNSIKNYLSTDALKKEYISYAKIGSLILSVSGVEDYAELKINGKTLNIQISAGAVPVLGDVIIS